MFLLTTPIYQLSIILQRRRIQQLVFRSMHTQPNFQFNECWSSVKKPKQYSLNAHHEIIQMIKMIRDN